MKKPFNKTLLWWGIGAVALIGALWALVAFSGGSTATNNTTLTAPKVTNADFQTQSGSTSAKVTLIEYADFQCPACKAYHPLLKQLLVDFGDKLNFVYRFFPLKTIHQNAINSARAAYAANKQGKFWQMHDKLFDMQDSWATLSNPEDTFISYAKDLGLSTDTFKKDYESTDAFTFVNSSYDAATNLGLNSTPTFFVNGKQITNPQSYNDFKKVLEDGVK